MENTRSAKAEKRGPTKLVKREIQSDLQNTEYRISKHNLQLFLYRVNKATEKAKRKSCNLVPRAFLNLQGKSTGNEVARYAINAEIIMILA